MWADGTPTTLFHYRRLADDRLRDARFTSSEGVPLARIERSADSNVEAYIARKKCTYGLTGEAGVTQARYRCFTCTKKNNNVPVDICESCTLKCHASHNHRLQPEADTFACACGRNSVTCAALPGVGDFLFEGDRSLFPVEPPGSVLGRHAARDENDVCSDFAADSDGEGASQPIHIQQVCEVVPVTANFFSSKQSQESSEEEEDDVTEIDHSRRMFGVEITGSTRTDTPDSAATDSSPTQAQARAREGPPRHKEGDDKEGESGLRRMKCMFTYIPLPRSLLD
jgi:hypothetical protein